MTTKLVNAGLKSKKEAVQALIDGRVFSTPSGHKIRFDSSFSNPFVKSGPGFCGIVDWGSHRTWTEEVEAKWYDSIPGEWVLCWVWDGYDGNPFDMASNIIGLCSRDGHLFVFADKHGTYWEHATPVRPDECWQG